MNLQGYLLLILIVSEYALYSAFGAATTSMDCSSSGVVGHSQDILCSVMGSLTVGITWTRPDDVAVAGCNLQHACIPMKGYDVPFANETLYILNIKSLQKLDAGDWVCRDGSEGKLAKGCKLTVDFRPSSSIFSSGAIAGIVTAFISVVIIIIIVACVKRYRRKKFEYDYNKM